MQSRIPRSHKRILIPVVLIFVCVQIGVLIYAAEVLRSSQSPGLEYVQPQKLGKEACCAVCNATRFTPDTEFDIVYTFLNMSVRSYQEYKAAHGHQVLTPDPHPWTYHELMWSLRSLVKHKMWDRVRMIHIVHPDVGGHGPPVFLSRDHPRVRLVGESTLHPGLPEPNREAIRHMVADIPGIADFFILADDDMMVQRPWNPDDYMDVQSGEYFVPLGPADGERITRKFVERVFGSWHGGQLLHGPFMMSKCVHSAFKTLYRHEYQNTILHQGDVQNVVFARSFNGNAAVHCGFATKAGFPGKWATEIHTNVIQRQASFFRSEAVNPNIMEEKIRKIGKPGGTGSVWVNVQGNGISDEYIDNRPLKLAYMQVMQDTFPEAFPGELPGYYEWWVQTWESHFKNNASQLKLL